MKRNQNKSSQISLVRQIFIFLIGATFLSVLIVGTLWINSKIGEYRKEVKKIRTSFSESQKAAIRYKILQTKDYLGWIRSHSADPVSTLLTKQAEKINGLFRGPAGRDNISEVFSRAANDTLFCLMIPFSVYNNENERIFEYRPPKFDTDPVPADLKASVLDQIFFSSGDQGQIVRFTTENESDVKPALIAGFIKNKAAELTVVSMACGEEQITEALKIFALDTISRIRYTENEYVFVNAIDGNALVTHGKLNPIPRKIAETGNAVWIKIFEMQKTSAEQQEGLYITYPWPLLNSSDTSYKTSYVSYFPEWGWILGTGFYEKDVEPLIAGLNYEMMTKFRTRILSIALYILVATILCYFLARHLSGHIYKNLGFFKEFFERSANEDERIDLLKLRYKEFVPIARAANRMAEQRKKAEKEIRTLNEELEERVRLRTAELEEANKDLELFSYSISHDLRAPLRAITGFSHILSTRHKSDLNEEGRKYMDFIVEAGQRMEKLISDLLNYSRVGRQKPDLQMVSVKDIYESVIMIFGEELEKARAHVSIQEDLPAIVSDKTLLLQIFTNLVSNAVKYRRPDVPLLIKCGYHKDGVSHVLYVSDNGIGIPEEYQSKIFEVFQRLHSENEYPGTGIGLASVKKAVSVLKGSIRIESTINEGSTFFIRLPEKSNNHL